VGVRTDEPPAPLVVLLYHRLTDPGDGFDRWNMTIAPPNFEAHMQVVARDFRPLRLSRAVDLLRRGSLPERSISVSFDDGYADNLTVALPTLRRWGVPATFFISGAAASSADGVFWWDRLAEAIMAAPMESTTARQLHHRLATTPPDARDGLLRHLPRSDAELPRRLTAGELVRLSQDPLADIGSHGWSHRALIFLGPEEIEHEIRRNVEALQEIVPLQSMFAYPFGVHGAVATRQVLSELEMTSAYRVASTAATRDSNFFALPRLEVGNWPGPRFARVLERLCADPHA
jgi:peptidoglycan/xylan/chitin deacetylase (PgdA/CDA1 family)